MPQVDVITGEERHRRWSLEEKQSILAAAFAPGAIAAHVAKRVNVSTGQLYTWRKQLMRKNGSGPTGFSQVVAVADLSRCSSAAADLPPAMTFLPPSAPDPATVAAPVCACPVIELEVCGNKVRIPPTMPVALASAVVRALVRRG
jgi:transposase